MSLLTAPPRADACEHCGAVLGEDQRYCLACGAASPAARMPPPRSVAAPPAASDAQPSSARDLTPVLALGGLLALAVVLIAGVLIGRSGSKPAAAAAPIVRVTGGGAAAASGADTASSGGAVATDWPGGASGWTVELGRVPKAGASAASVASARAAAAKKGAPKIGVLDSDSHGSLPGGDYVIYSGRYGTKAKANAAAKKLRGRFPGAKVVHVASGGGSGGGGGGGSSSGSGGAASGTKAKKAIQDLNQSGTNYEQQLKKKPKTIVVPGKAPKKDDKAPGGGSAAQSIG